eukprot:COSAG02_NODE_46231_length_350_cov_1.294821_1_plen_66_part_01
MYFLGTRVHSYINVFVELQIPTSFFEWSVFEDRATPLVGVALINVSQFFFSADHGNRVRFAVIFDP